MAFRLTKRLKSKQITQPAHRLRGHIMNTAAVLAPLDRTYSGTKGKILEMLGSGMGPEIVSTACGVTPSYVSQLLADQEFAEAVAARRFELLSRNNARDAKADAIEDAALEKLDSMLGMVYNPMQVLKIYQVVNAAKRRGSAGQAEASTVINNQVVNLVLPPAISQRFTRDANNQVIEVAAEEVRMVPETQITKQTLVTMPSSRLRGMIDARSGRKSADELALENKNVFIDPTTKPTGG